MDKKPANQVVQKKIPKKRKFQSVPNIPIENLRIKANDTFLVSPEDIRKFKEGNKGVDEKPKKNKGASAKKPTKKPTKDMGKLLLEPNQTAEDKQAMEDYNWMIKKNIVKLMSAAKRKLQNEQKMQKAEKEKGADKEKPATACPKSKPKKKERKKEENLVKAVKSDVQPKSTVKKEKFESRAFSAHIPQTRIQSAIRKDNLMILQPEVIKERDEKFTIKKILQETKIKEAKPKKGKKQTTEKNPDFAEFSSVMQAEKKKKKKTDKIPKEKKKSTKQPVKVTQ